jgi:mannitol/fructose-specific phosphotransferase system IIA component (Ntr-type)
MKIHTLLTEQAVLIPLEAGTPSAALEALLDRAAACGGVTDRKAALEALQKREALASTAMDYGVAVPHARCGAVDDLVFVLGISRHGIGFGAQDRMPSRIFFFFLTPEATAGSTVRLLARIAQLGSDEGVRSALMAAETAVQALDALREKESKLPD